MMTKKDFEMLADALATARAKYFTSGDVAVVDTVIRTIGAELLNTNPRFDLNRFCTAAMSAPKYSKTR